MVSIWWLIAAFFGGASAGMLVIALMQMSAGLTDGSTRMPELEPDL
jgi:hypothetical protein